RLANFQRSPATMSAIGMSDHPTCASPRRFAEYPSLARRSRMTLDDIKPTSPQRFYNDPAAVDAAEKQLGTRLPAGYRQFITRFGEGTLGVYVRVYPPYQILEGDNCVAEWRKRIDEYWFWDEGKDVLPK